MAAILIVGNSEGTRRCDATCHNARHDTCACICAGRYHGKGLEAARKQLTQDYANEEAHLKELAKRGTVKYEKPQLPFRSEMAHAK